MTPDHAMGRLEGRRRRVRYFRAVSALKGMRVLRMVLECGHTVHRRDVGTHPIWAICEKCPIEEKLGD